MNHTALPLPDAVAAPHRRRAGRRAAARARWCRRVRGGAPSGRGSTSPSITATRTPPSLDVHRDLEGRRGVPHGVGDQLAGEEEHDLGVAVEALLLRARQPRTRVPLARSSASVRSVARVRCRQRYRSGGSRRMGSAVPRLRPSFMPRRVDSAHQSRVRPPLAPRREGRPRPARLRPSTIVGRVSGS